MTAHTNFRQNQLVFVQLRSGESFNDRFIERRSNHVVLKERGKVAMSDLRAISIKRGSKAK